MVWSLLRERRRRMEKIPMITKREKLQYAYVFVLDIATLALSVIVAWLITDGLLGRIVPYEIGDWLQTICLLLVAFLMTFVFLPTSMKIL